MKNYVILGIVALVMMLLTVPVMADTSAPVNVNGTVVQTLSISANSNINFGNFIVGDNRQDTGTISVTSAFIPHWTVVASTTDGYGYMRIGGAPSGTFLASKLQEYNYLKSPAANWENVQGLTFVGSSDASMTETFLQNVVISDAPGNYSTVVTYTITAA